MWRAAWFKQAVEKRSDGLDAVRNRHVDRVEPVPITGCHHV